jgi:hypothetical protein
MRSFDFVQLLEPRRLMASFSAAEGTMFAQAGKPSITISLTGPGSGEATFENGELVLSLRNTTKRSSLTIDTGGERLTARSVRIRNPIGNILTPTVDYRGTASFNFVDSFVARSIWSGRVNATFVNNIDLGEMRGGVLSTERIGRLFVRRGVTNAAISAVPPTDDVYALGSATIRGTMSSSTIATMSDIGNVSIGEMNFSALVAGVKRLLNNSTGMAQFAFPEAAGTDLIADFTGRYKIDSVRVGQNNGSASFMGSNIAAHDVVEVGISNYSGPVSFIDSRKNFGVSAVNIGRIVAPRPAGLTVANAGEASFTVRQLKEPEKLVYVPATGTYGGTLSGAIRSSASANLTLTNGTWNNTDLIGGVETTFTSLPTNYVTADGKSVGTATGMYGGNVWTFPGGTFLIRNNKNKVVLRSANFTELMTTVVGPTTTGLKIYTLGGNLVARETSVGASLSVGTQFITSPTAKPMTVMRDAVLNGSSGLTFNPLIFAGGQTSGLSFVPLTQTAHPIRIPRIADLKAEARTKRTPGWTFLDNVTEVTTSGYDTGDVARLSDGPMVNAILGGDFSASIGDTRFNSLDELTRALRNTSGRTRQFAPRVSVEGDFVVVTGASDGGSFKLRFGNQTFLGTNGQVTQQPKQADLEGIFRG